MRKTPNRDKVWSVIRRFMGKFRDDAERMFGDGDHSLAISLVVTTLLGRGDLYVVCGSDRHVVLRMTWGGQLHDIDVYSDVLSGDPALRIQVSWPDELRYGSSSPDLVALDLRTVDAADWDRIEAALLTSGDGEYAELRPAVRALRQAVARQP